MKYGLKYELLSKALKEIRRRGEKGSFARLSEKSGVSLPVIGRLADQKQKTVTFGIWQKLHAAEPDLIPAPTIESATNSEFSNAAIEKYPVIEDITKRIREAMAKGHSYSVLLTVLRNDIDSALALEKNGNSGVRKTG
jgi:hypothetical protein